MNKLLSLLTEAMTDERHDFIKYKRMMDMTNSKEIKEQINFAHMDEGKHYRMFQEIYEDLTGSPIEIPFPEVEQYNRLTDAVKTSINGELAAVELYREIRSLLNTKKHRDMVYEIITDEQEHATRFVYVYSLLK